MTYPSSLDELTDGVPSDGAAPTTALDNATYPHDDHHRALAVAVEAVEAELGTDPSGASATVAARFTATETVANAAAAKASNLSDLTSASTARTNLGLGGAATLSVGTSAGTVAAGDDARFSSSASAHVLSVVGGASLVGVPGVGFVTAATGAIVAGRDHYAPFRVEKALTITFAQVEVTTGPASAATIYVGIYAATNADQPTGSPLLNTTISCAQSATGIKSVTSLSAALPAGNYVSVFNTDVNLTLRVYGGTLGSLSPNLGTGPSYGFGVGSRTAGAFTSSPTAWDNIALQGGMFMRYNALFFKWTTP